MRPTAGRASSVILAVSHREYQGSQFLEARGGTMENHEVTEHARQHGADKRGAPFEQIPIDAAHEPGAKQEDVNRMDLDAALSRLAEFEPEQCKLVELRYFAGLSIEET